MKICFIGKYPPVEGGESSKLYWLAKELGKRGHEVHIITNSFCVEDEFRERFRGADLKFYQPKGVKVHNLDPFALPVFVLRSPSYAQRLTALAYHVVVKYNPDLIEGWYLIPYGTAAFLTSAFTKKPYIVRHAGSDLNKLGNSLSFKFLIDQILKNADRVITYPSRAKMLKEKGVIPYRLFIDRSTSVDTNFFSPENKISARYYLPSCLSKDKNVPIITYIGKLSINKGLVELIRALSLVKKKSKKFKFLILGNGRRIFKNKIDKQIKKLNLEEEAVFAPFIPPWRIPGVINLSSLIVHPEHGFPIEVHNPILIREIMACGGCLLLSRELYNKQPREFVQKDKNVVVIEPQKEKQFAKEIINLLVNPKKIKQIGKGARKAALKREDFTHYVDEFEKFYQRVIRKNAIKDKSQRLIVFRGPPAAGKTTISREIKKQKPDLAVIKFDTMRRIISDDPDPYAFKGLTFKMVENLAEFLINCGCSVLVEGLFIYEKEIEPFFNISRKYNISLKTFELSASLKILKKRLDNKPKDPLEGGVTNFNFLFSAFANSRLDEKKYSVFKIDTGKNSICEIAKKIIAQAWKD